MSVLLSLHLQTLEPKIITHPCYINSVRCMSIRSSMPLKDVSTPAWRKQRGFDQLEIAVSSLKRTHQIANLIELVSTEISIDVHSAAQDATKQIQRTLASVYDINNLNVSVFLTATVKQVQLKSEKFADRPDGLSFFRFSYNLDSTSISPRIMQKPTFFYSAFAYNITGIFGEKIVLKIFIRRYQNSRVQRKSQRLVGLLEFRSSYAQHRRLREIMIIHQMTMMTTPSTPKINILFKKSLVKIMSYFR